MLPDQAGKRVRLRRDDMEAGGGRAARLQAAECHDLQSAADLAQMAGRLPWFVGQCRKAGDRPQRWRRVTAVLHEGEPLGVGDEDTREFYWTHQRAMRRLFVVEMEAVVGVPDRVDALVERDPFLAAAGRSREFPLRIIGRRDRGLRKRMQDVGQHQFLMLLLVVETDLYQRRDRGQGFVPCLMKEFHDGRIDMTAVGGDFLGAWTREMAALVTGVAWAGADVI